jgi:hypothetical protein
MNGTELKRLIEEKYKGNPRVWVIRTNATNGANFKIKPLPKGFADLTVLVIGGQTIFAETKSKNEKQREDQVKFQSRVESMGFEYWLIESLEDFDARIEARLA